MASLYPLCKKCPDLVLICVSIPIVQVLGVVVLNVTCSFSITFVLFSGKKMEVTNSPLFTIHFDVGIKVKTHLVQKRSRRNYQLSYHSFYLSTSVGTISQPPSFPRPCIHTVFNHMSPHSSVGHLVCSCPQSIYESSQAMQVAPGWWQLCMLTAF